MRRRKWAAFLVVLGLTPITAHAQDKQTKQAERQIAAILTEFNEDMRGYERELKYFQHVAEFKPLSELHAQLIAQVAQMSKLETEGRGSGPAILQLAREMDQTVRKLDVATGSLEQRAKAVSSREDRAVAERMRAHANAMVRTTDKLLALFR
jgi:hypothetical protein